MFKYHVSVREVLIESQNRHELQLHGTMLIWFSYHERANFIPVNEASRE